MKPLNNKAKGDIKALEDWLASLNLHVKPTVHVNPNFSGAVIVVDFGSPVVPVQLSSEQNSELNSRMKGISKTLISNNNVNVKVSFDAPNGVHYAGT